jgi:hypothetical protein
MPAALPRRVNACSARIRRLTAAARVEKDDRVMFCCRARMTRAAGRSRAVARSRRVLVWLRRDSAWFVDTTASHRTVRYKSAPTTMPNGGARALA